MSTAKLKLLAAPTPCRVCGLLTCFAKFGGSIPLHPMCDSRAWFELASPEDEAHALALVANVLGPVIAAPPDPPLRPEEVGPCARCRRPMRRYGPWARSSYCERCR